MWGVSGADQWHKKQGKPGLEQHVVNIMMDISYEGRRVVLMLGGVQCQLNLLILFGGKLIEEIERIINEEDKWRKRKDNNPIIAGFYI